MCIYIYIYICICMYNIRPQALGVAAHEAHREGGVHLCKGS